MDTVMGLPKIEHADTDVSFRVNFQKARERTPETRADFADKHITLIGNVWRVEDMKGDRKEVGINPRKFFEALCEACNQVIHNCPAATVEAWRENCFRHGLLDREKPDSARTLFNRHKLTLIAANWAASNETHAWTLAPHPTAQDRGVF
jgi:hypothetical protein